MFFNCVRYALAALVRQQNEEPPRNGTLNNQTLLPYFYLLRNWRTHKLITAHAVHHLRPNTACSIILMPHSGHKPPLTGSAISVVCGFFIYTELFPCLFNVGPDNSKKMQTLFIIFWSVTTSHIPLLLPHLSLPTVENGKIRQQTCSHV